MEWRANPIERGLFKFKDINNSSLNNNKSFFMHVELIKPKKLKTVIIDFDSWTWNTCYLRDPLNYEKWRFNVADSEVIFEAPDDESAKLIFEVGRDAL